MYYLYYICNAYLNKADLQMNLDNFLQKKRAFCKEKSFLGKKILKPLKLVT